MDNEIVRIYVDKDLEDELKIRREIYEKKIGYTLKGGMAPVSKICARILREQRQKERGCIKVECQKMVGVKKSEVFLL